MAWAQQAKEVARLGAKSTILQGLSRLVLRTWAYTATLNCHVHCDQTQLAIIILLVEVHGEVLFCLLLRVEVDEPKAAGAREEVVVVVVVVVV